LLQHERLDVSIGLLYRAIHANHPINLWAAKNRVNINWVIHYFLALAEEYEYRFGKVHKCVTTLDFVKLPKYKQPKEFCNCAANKSLGLDFKHLPVIKAYRTYFRKRIELANDKLKQYKAEGRKASRKPKWTKRKPPVWL
jgi:hypothetical protein